MSYVISLLQEEKKLFLNVFSSSHEIALLYHYSKYGKQLQQGIIYVKVAIQVVICNWSKYK